MNPPIVSYGPDGRKKLMYEVPASFEGATLLAFLKNIGFSSRLISSQKLVEGGFAVNGEDVTVRRVLHRGDSVSVTFARDKKDDADPSSSLCGICFENESAVVFNKPPAMPTHRTIRHPSDTLENVFASLYDLTFRPVSRLDKDTSGAVAVAKDAFCACVIAGSLEKTYTAVCEGELPAGYEGMIDAPVARVNSTGILRTVSEEGQDALTYFTGLASSSGHSLLRVRPVTGRTHQIRVHLSHIGHPIAGDDMYGGSQALIGRQFLHCSVIGFHDPLYLCRRTVRAPLPPDLARLASDLFGEDILSKEDL